MKILISEVTQSNCLSNLPGMEIVILILVPVYAKIQKSAQQILLLLLHLVGFYISSFWEHVSVCVSVRVCPLIINPLADLRPGYCLHTDLLTYFIAFYRQYQNWCHQRGTRSKQPLRGCIFRRLLLITFAGMPALSPINLSASRTRQNHPSSNLGYAVIRELAGIMPSAPREGIW